MPELATANRMYGHAALLKQYARLPASLPLPFAVQHGWFGGRPPTANAVEVASGLGLIWAWTRALQEQYAALGVSSLVGGAPFVYACAAQGERTERGKGTLAFPVHGTARVRVSGDFAGYAAALQELPEQFQPIAFCLHPGDIGGPLHLLLEGRGVTVLSNGLSNHPSYLFNFIRNVRSHAYVTSNGMSTALLYAAHLGIPTFRYGPRFEHENLADPHVPLGPLREADAPNCAKLEGLFGLENLHELELRARAARDELGAEHMLAPEDLRRSVLRSYCRVQVGSLLSATTKRAYRWVLQRSSRR